MASVKLPTPAELAAVGKQLGMSLSDDDVKFFLETWRGVSPPTTSSNPCPTIVSP